MMYFVVLHRFSPYSINYYVNLDYTELNSTLNFVNESWKLQLMCPVDMHLNFHFSLYWATE